jgi:hypothetical protein
MKSSKYADNTVVPVGYLDAANAKYVASGDSDAVLADTTVRVTPTAGGVWIAIGTAPTAAANTNGSHYLDQAQDFAIESGDKINSTGAINITPFK